MKMTYQLLKGEPLSEGWLRVGRKDSEWCLDDIWGRKVETNTRYLTRRCIIRGYLFTFYLLSLD